MQVRSHKLTSYIESKPAAPCAQCGRTLFAPEWSEYLGDRRVRHLWMCATCDYHFETLVVFPAEPAVRQDEKGGLANRVRRRGLPAVSAPQSRNGGPETVRSRT
jgi:hypothetical protein